MKNNFPNTVFKNIFLNQEIMHFLIFNKNNKTIDLNNLIKLLLYEINFTLNNKLLKNYDM